MKPSRTQLIFGYFGLLYISILIVQSARWIYLDAISQDGSQIDLSGYFINSGIGLLLSIDAIKKHNLLLRPILIVGFFLIILVINILFNTTEQLISVLFSRHGVLSWFLIGVWTAIAVANLRANLENGIHNLLFSAAIVFLYLCMAPIAWLVYSFLPEPAKTLSYQVVTSNSILLICVAVLTFHAISQSVAIGYFVLYAPIYLFLALSVLLVYSVTLMGSTGIVAFYITALPIFLISFITRRNVAYRLIILVIAVGVLLLTSINYFVDDWLQNTRLGVVSEGILTIDSIETRLGLLPLFNQQIVVAPIFGDFRAEISAGFYKGEYIHSLPLSLLTHTGIVGFLLIAVTCVILFVYKFKESNYCGPKNQLSILLFLLIIALASLYAFFTWSPFWFILGYMCVRSYKAKIYL